MVFGFSIFEKSRIMRLFSFCTVMLLLFQVSLLRAQRYSLLLHCFDSSGVLPPEMSSLAREYKNQNSARQALNDLIFELQEKGYLEASVDSLHLSDQTLDACIHLGQKWRWAKISLKQVPINVLVGTGINELQYSGTELRPRSVAKLCEHILNWCENNGFPFARVQLDSVNLSGKDGIIAQLMVEPNQIRTIDSIILEGNARLDKVYLGQLLDIREASLYQEYKLQSIQQKLNNLSFLDPSSSWHITFGRYHTKLYLNLKERRANQLNALIGLQPNTGGSDKFLLTADVQAAFQNILGRGEALSFSYQKLQEASPRIKAAAQYPYLLRTPIGVDSRFDLYFNGTSFRKTSLDIGGSYLLSAQNTLRIYYQNINSRIINPDTAYILANHRLPEVLDLTANGLGLSVQTEQTDYKFNPRRGYNLSVSGIAFKRNIIKNDGITGIKDGSGFDYATLYDSLSIPKYQFQLTAQLNKFWPITDNLVLKLGYAGAWISGEKLYQNELYQIGGMKLLRGFDEESIFANQYHLLNGELRFLFSRNSNFYCFSDNAWVQTTINGFSKEGWYHGFGIGTQLEVKNGQFNIAYALGKAPNSPILFRQSKIHVGYVAYF